MSVITPDAAMLQHEIERLAVKAGHMILKADASMAHEGGRVADRSTDRAAVTVTHKSGRRDLVTSVDLQIQRMLMKRLQIFVDDCRFFCEEELPAEEDSSQRGRGTTPWDTEPHSDETNLPPDRSRAKAGRSSSHPHVITDPAEVNEGICFIIDPIDGTANFVHGQRHSCTSIAMTVDGQTRLGVIYDPYRQELFSACLGRGAWLNGHRLPTFDADIADAITVFGTAPYDDTTNAPTFQLAHLLYELSADVRRTGSAALDCCWTACGRFGLYAELSLSPWDFAAGKLIAEETGCLVTDIEGQPLQLEGKPSILCGRPTAVRQFLAAQSK